MSRRSWFVCGSMLLLLLASGCTRKQAQAPSPPPPKPKLSVVVLLPEQDGKTGVATLTNASGTYTLSEPYQALRIERPDVAPPSPKPMDREEVRSLFGSVIDALPPPEVVFTLHYGRGSDVLLPE